MWMDSMTWPERIVSSCFYWQMGGEVGRWKTEEGVNMILYFIGPYYTAQSYFGQDRSLLEIKLNDIVCIFQGFISTT